MYLIALEPMKMQIQKNGHNFTGEVIEAFLAHKETNKVKEAYNRSSYKDAMRGLIEWYVNYLNLIIE